MLTVPEELPEEAAQRADFLVQCMLDFIRSKHPTPNDIIPDNFQRLSACDANPAHSNGNCWVYQFGTQVSYSKRRFNAINELDD